jgi:sugar phosphate isomerase/epimerase
MSLFALAPAALAQHHNEVAVPKPNYAAMDKLGWKLAAQAYTFGRNGVSCFDTLDILKDLGIRYVELFPGQSLSADHKDVKTGPAMSAADISALKAKLQATGVTAVAFGVTGIGNNEANARKLFEWAKTMGITTIVSEPAANEFELIDKLANEYKIKVALHNHPKPSPYWDPQVVLDRTQGRSNMIGACSDTGHWARSGLVALDCLKKLEGKTVELHFKDLNKSGGDAHDVPWGTGACDFKAMLAELKRQKFQGVFSIEYEIGNGPELVANVGKCVQNFSDAAAELAKD